MSKELRITATKEVPDDAIEQAHLLSSFKTEIDALSKALGVKVEAKIVTPSGPRKKAETAPPPATHHNAKAG